MDTRSKILTLVPPVGRRKRLPHFDGNVGLALSPVSLAVTALLNAEQA
jgi:hypothetical protein